MSFELEHHGATSSGEFRSYFGMPKSRKNSEPSCSNRRRVRASPHTAGPCGGPPFSPVRSELKAVCLFIGAKQASVRKSLNSGLGSNALRFGEGHQLRRWWWPI